MNVLFVCQANVGRSQVAMELYRKAGGQADSSGTKVDTPGATLAERPSSATIVEIMREKHNVDMIHNVRTQITEQNATGYDKIIVMAEKETVPDWLFADSRAEFWTIDDPKGPDVATTNRIVQEVEQHLQPLLQALDT
jgi:protein-tyrosine-phosphatase